MNPLNSKNHGPFEYKASSRAQLRNAHREKLLRTPLRVLQTQPPVTSEDEFDLGPIPTPVRNFECPNYEICLNLTAALDWHSFTCKGCQEKINEKLLERASRALDADHSLEPLIGNLSAKK